MDTLFSMALQCQVKDAFSATQDKSESIEVEALTIVCAGELSPLLNIVSFVHNFAANFLLSFLLLSNYPIV